MLEKGKRGEGVRRAKTIRCNLREQIVISPHSRKRSQKLVLVAVRKVDKKGWVWVNWLGSSIQVWTFSEVSGGDDHEHRKVSGARGSVTPRMPIVVTEMGSWGPVTALVEMVRLVWLFTFIYFCVCEWVSVRLGGYPSHQRTPCSS